MAPRAPRLHRVAAWTGVSIWMLGLAGLVVLWRSSPTQATAAFLALITFYYAGQFGAIPLGLAAGGDPWVVGLYVWAADAAGLLVFFPLTQLAVDRVAQRPGLLSGWILRLRARAQRRRRFVDRYGPLGLFAFTTLPFLFNSPILGAVIGRVAGIRSGRTLAALLSAITIMSAVWTALFFFGLGAAQAMDSRLPWLIGFGSVGLTLLIAGSAAAWRFLRRRDRAPAGPTSLP
jgi:uncharacterized membrane protein